MMPLPPIKPMLERFENLNCFCAHVFVVLVYLASTSPAFAKSDSSPREIVPFDTGWRFQIGDDAAARQPGFGDKSWRILDLPHDWSVEWPINPPPDGDKSGGFFSHGIGWYRKSFTLDHAAGKKVVIEFDGVYMNSEIWINGHFLGRRPYGFVGFRYDLTEFLNTNDVPNVLAVRVDDSLEPALRWYAGSGIYRHVRLITTSYAHFRLDGGVAVSTPIVSSKSAIVEVGYIIDAHFFTEAERQAWLANVWKPHPSTNDIVLRSYVEELDGKIVASAVSKLALDNLHPGQRTTQRVKVPNPRLWSDRTPQLYQLRSTLSMDGHALDETTTKFGIRQMKFDSNRGLLVNGQPIKLKGVCLHQDAASFGNAVPAGIWAWRLSRLKEMGCNAIRTSHHPFAPEFYDLCDEMGFYVLDEAFDEWTLDWTYNFTENPRGKSAYGYHLYFDQWHDTDLRAMVRRDRNHPSVVIYSIGNEIPNQKDRDGYNIARELVAICHEEDPTRPVTSACDQSAAATRNGFMDALDIAGYNYVGRLYGTNTYAPDRQRFPHRLCLGTETTYASYYWLGVRDHNYVIGDFIWTGMDYLGEARHYPERGNHAGMLDLAGGKKPEYYQRAAYWRDDSVLQLVVINGVKPESDWRPAEAFIKWNWPDGSHVTVRAVANCDEVELFLNNRSLGRRAVSRDVYYSDWSVDYEPGVLSAVGYRAGKPVSVQELRTTGEPTRLQINPLVLPVTNDITLYEITVVDAAGLTVQDATPSVTVSVEGAGKLVGLDTGDLTYDGNFKTNARNAYLGRLLATVQRTASDGDIRVIAVSSGLPTASEKTASQK
jgi:beta-galactosidase